MKYGSSLPSSDASCDIWRAQELAASAKNQALFLCNSASFSWFTCCILQVYATHTNLHASNVVSSE